MRKYLIALLAVFTLWQSRVLAQTQGEMNDQAAGQATQMKQQLAKTMRKLASSFGQTKGFKNKLDESQELWKNFMDAHLDAIFPVAKNEDSHLLYGSVYPMCVANFQAEITEARLSEMKNWTKQSPHKTIDALNQEYAGADKALNAAYTKVMHSSAKKIARFKENLIKAEVAWIAFRDADADLYALSASSPEAAHVEKMIALTKERTQQLNKWITGTEEGDVCAGSYPVH